MDRFLMNHVRDRVRASDPILQVGHTFQHEGTRRYLQQSDGTKRFNEYRESRSSLAMDQAAYRKMDVPQLMEMLESTIRDQAGQMAAIAYQKLAQTTAETGNVVDAGGAPYSFELSFQMLEKVEFEFDDDLTKPILPTPIVPPGVAAVWEQRRQEWFADPANQKRFLDLLKAKYEQWRTRENRRTLVG